MSTETVLRIQGNSEGLYADVCKIIASAQSEAFRAINVALVQRNWLIGKRIAEEELKGNDRAEYGAEIIKQLSDLLTRDFGKGFTKTNLYQFYQFYKSFPNIFHSLSGKSILLTWTHYRTLLREDNEDARNWYEKEAAEQQWSVRTLERNISSQYYHRILLSQNKVKVENEMKQLTKDFQNDKLEFIKNPVVAEFLGLSSNIDFTENELESSIISNLQRFLMEMGKGYAFVARQQHIRTDENDYYIDLVFYNYILKCFVLIDLKTTKISYQDVGQMDMYLQIYDKMKRSEGDNPTIGIILCSETDSDVARFSTLAKNDQLFASKYKLYMPTQEELRAEIERQKMIFRLEQENRSDNK